MPKYIGNTADIVDWDAIVKICSENNNGDKNTPSGVITRSQE